MGDVWRPWGLALLGIILTLIDFEKFKVMEMVLYIAIGWTLLFIIPGLIAAYRYQLTGYILAENPEMGANDAITRSKELMKGNKWRLFCLDFSFIGWDILSAFTLGIGDLWLTPYRSAAAAAFYRELVPLEKGEEPEEMQETQTEEDVISEE